MLDGSILQLLQEAHQSGEGQRSLNFGVYYKNTLVALCHALEDAILDSDHQPMMITAFQRGKWYLEEAERYGAIAACSQQVVIMACPDAGFQDHPTSQRENVAVVGLAADDPVAKEWHLIIVSPTYTAMVLCQELSDADYGVGGRPTADLDRKFYGLWTFEPQLVHETAALAIAHLHRYQPDLQHRLAEQLHQMATAVSAKQQAPGNNLPPADQLGDIVSRVVDYLEIRHQDLTLDTLSYVAAVDHLDNNLTSNELQAFLRMAQLIDQTDLSNPMAAAEVATMAEAMGQLLDLPAWQIHRLRLAGLLHRLAFLHTFHTDLNPGSSVSTETELGTPPSCPLVPGIQVLRKMPRLRAIAAILTHQTEWWNGSGQPAGLAGDEIPIESRILGLTSEFQQRLVRQRAEQPDADPAELLPQVLAHCQQGGDERWDPKLLEVLVLLTSALQQGLSLPVTLPKIAAGLWLLDSRSEADLLSQSTHSTTP